MTVHIWTTLNALTVVTSTTQFLQAQGKLFQPFSS